MKEGDVGAEVFFSFFAPGPGATGAVEFSLRLPNEFVVLIPKFFKFLGFLAGVMGLCSSKNVLCDGSEGLSPVLRDRKSGTNEDAATLATGDSGEGPGEGSVTEDESMVDIVVVGEESDDSDANVEVLSRCT